ncbi:hypothetical protein [Staphylococcus caledonicus]|uniref:hypothetical protein n=1 Tax=Staphylococcus caledonicus TaxID=2741333 RepID=UPI0018E4040F|nr:hypothetical protein [Staphylococcus caledonicus]MBI5973650.1 hypothetical protein [Staphylococcus caledonicus]
MLNNDNYSMLELIIEANECRNGIKKIDLLPKKQKEIVSLSYLNIISMVAEGIISICPQILSSFEDINDKTMEEIIKSTRLENKIYAKQKVAKSIKGIQKSMLSMNYIMTNSYNCIQNLFIKLFGQDNLSIATYNNKIIYSSHQIFEQLEDLIYKNNLESLKTKNNIIAYSKNISLLINLFCEGIKQTNLAYCINSSIKKMKLFDIELNDDNVTNSKYFNNNLDDEVILFLLKILSSINFMRFVLPKIINDRSPLYTRYKLIIYISSCNSLSILEKNFNYSKQINVDYIEELKLILDSENKMINNKLRNNIFHYKIEEILIKEDRSIIEQIIMNEKMGDLNEYLILIDGEIIKIAKLIEKIILK